MLAPTATLGSLLPNIEFLVYIKSRAAIHFVDGLLVVIIERVVFEVYKESMAFVVRNKVTRQLINLVSLSSVTAVGDEELLQDVDDG